MRIRIRNGMDIFLWTNVCLMMSVSFTVAVSYSLLPLDIFLAAFLSNLAIASVLSVGLGLFGCWQIYLAQRNHVELRKVLDYDQLTNVLTRARFFADVDRYSDMGGAIAMIDIDHFKQINDTYGHAAGDEVLNFLGGMLNGTTRRADMVARFGGEEFVAFFPDTSVEQARNLLERLRVRLANASVEHESQLIQVTVSIGVTGCDVGEQPSSKLGQADEALYLAKSAGRDRIVVADQDIEQTEPQLSAANDPVPKHA